MWWRDWWVLVVFGVIILLIIGVGGAIYGEEGCDWEEHYIDRRKEYGITEETKINVYPFDDGYTRKTVLRLDDVEIDYNGKIYKDMREYIIETMKEETSN